jgi:hypothetical protein
VSKGALAVEWQMTKLSIDNLDYDHFIISIIGTEFDSTIESHRQFPHTIESGDKQIPAMQHSWITKFNGYLENKFLINGIIDTAIYE